MNLPVDKCLMLRENGLDQALNWGDQYWRYIVAHGIDSLKYAHPVLYELHESYAHETRIKAPTLSQLLDFAKQLAEKRWGDKLLGIEQDLDINQDPQYRASVRYCNNNRVNGYVGYIRVRSYAPELVLVALIEEILKQEVK